MQLSQIFHKKRISYLRARCVLNGLETVLIPPELSRLDTLSAQLIQRAKCYQTIVRLKKTLETLDGVKCSSSGETALPDPELYIIINGKPTSSKIVWHSLLNVEHVKKAVQTLKDMNINWL